MESDPKKAKTQHRYEGINFTDKESHHSLKIADIKLICKDGVVLYAHRLELLFVPFFRDLITDDLMKSNELPLALKFENISYEVIEILLYYVYSLNQVSRQKMDLILENLSLFDQLLEFIDAKALTFLVEYLHASLTERKKFRTVLYPIIVKHSKYGHNKAFNVEGLTKSLEIVFLSAFCSRDLSMRKYTNSNDVKFYITNFELNSYHNLLTLYTFEPKAIAENFAEIETKLSNCPVEVIIGVLRNCHVHRSYNLTKVSLEYLYKRTVPPLAQNNKGK